MTRWARSHGGKRAHDATSWNELKSTTTTTTTTTKHGGKKRKPSQEERKQNAEARKNIPASLAKRHEARRLRRLKSKPCFHCRKPGHLSSACPLKEEGDVDNLCFKCGSDEHTVHECTVTTQDGAQHPFAKCFICKQTGHLSGACPDNPRGLYPDGGGCKFCGSVEHYRRDCPERNTGDEGGAGGARKKVYKMREDNDDVEAIVDSEEEMEESEIIAPVKAKKKKIVVF